jgi:hypothetical protein
MPAVWFGLVSFPARAWGCTVMLESGAVYRNIAPHHLSFTQDQSVDWSIQSAQTWDCYGYDFTTIEYDYLRGLSCNTRAGKSEFMGRYLFTAAPVDDAFSGYPEQAKEFSFVQLDNGRLTIQPTNHLIFSEKSFTRGAMEFPNNLKRQTDVFRCE